MDYYDTGQKRMFDKSVMMYFMLFTDMNPELAVSVNRDPAMQLNIAKEHIVDIVNNYYFEELYPPVVWNFNSYVNVVPQLWDDGQKQRVKFWDDETREIIDKAKYFDLISGMRSTWREGLVEAYPYYDRDKLEDGFENTHFEYYPDEGMIACIVLLEKLLPL